MRTLLTSVCGGVCVCDGVCRIEKAMAGAVLRARTDVEDSENVEFKINAQSSIKEGQLIHRLAARSLIKYFPPLFLLII